jgi:hypothetical protein
MLPSPFFVPTVYVCQFLRSTHYKSIELRHVTRDSSSHSKPTGMPAAADIAVTLIVSALITAFAKLSNIAIGMSA